MGQDITIPPAALEAGARVIKLLTAEGDRDSIIIAHAAFLAMLEAWPGVGRDWSNDEEIIALPLTESPDDKA